MPQSISAPLPHAVAEPNAREHARAARQSWSAQPIESRVSALEARWEETVPTLATRSDMHGELRAVENRLIIWILGAAFSLLFAVLGIFLAGYNTINERFDSVNARFDSVNTRINSAVTELRTETKASIADLRDELRAEIRETRDETRAASAELRASITELRAEIRETNARIDSRFDALMSELRGQRNDSR